MSIKNKKNPKALNYTLKKSLPFFFNYGALSYIFIIFNLLGEHILSVNLSIFQSILFLYTASLSGDFRNIVLSNKTYYEKLLRYRIFSTLVFFILAIFSIPFIDKNYLLILSMLALRKFIDWLEEILLIRDTKKNLDFIYLITQLFFLLPFPFIFLYFQSWIFIFFALWIFSTIFIFSNSYKIILNKDFYRVKLKISFTNQINIKSQIYATFFMALGNFVLRYSISKLTDIDLASSIISSLSIGGFTGSLVSNVFTPNVLSYYKKRASLINTLERYVFSSSFIAVLIIYVNLGRNFIEDLNLNFYTLIMSFLAGNILLLSNYKRMYLIQIKKVTTEKEDFIINLFLLIFIYILFNQLNNYYQCITLITALCSLVVFSFRESLLSVNKGIIFSWIIVYFSALVLFPVLLIVWVLNV